MSVAVPSRGNRYTIVDVREAQRLADSGWSKREIARMLSTDGRTINERTVAVWVDPTIAQRRGARVAESNRRRARHRGKRPLGFSRASIDLKLSRLEKLTELGLSSADVAAVMSFDFGDRLSAGQVRYALVHGRYPARAGRSSGDES